MGYYQTILIYTLVALLGAYFIHLSKRGKIYPLSSGYYLFFILYVSLASLRYVGGIYGGTDAGNYQDIFLNCLKSENRFSEQDILFGWYNILIRHITESAIIYRSISYSIITFGYIYLIKTIQLKGIKSTCIPLILLILPFLKSFNTMRTSMAIAVFLIGIAFLFKKKNIIGSILIISTVLIHRMSILYVLFLPFYYCFRNYDFRQLNLKKIFFISSILICGYFGALKVQAYVIAIQILDGTDAYYIQKSLDSSLSNSIIVIIPLALIFIAWAMSYKNLILTNETSLLSKLIAFDIIVCPMALVFGMWRANEYLFLVRCIYWSILIPILCRKLMPQNPLLLKKLIFILIIMWIIYRMIKEATPTGTIPYKLII